MVEAQLKSRRVRMPDAETVEIWMGFRDTTQTKKGRMEQCEYLSFINTW